MRLACFVAALLAYLFFSALASAQQCPQGYPMTVTSFTIAPSQILGDGHEVAIGTATINNQSPYVGPVPVCLTGGFTHPVCVPPAIPPVGSFACGCTAPTGTNYVQFAFSNSVSVTTTITDTAAIPFPYNPSTCPDPGQNASLTFLVPQDLSDLPPPIDGPCPDGGCAGHPINLTNGDLWITQQDYALPGLGGGINLTRTWNSIWPTFSPPEMSGTFGHSWRSTFNERLQSITGGIKYWLASGSQWIFTYDSLNQVYNLSLPLREHGSLTLDPVQSQYTLTLADGTRKIFNNSGYLIAVVDRNNNQVTVSYDGSNRITQVTDAAGRSITFSYNDAANPSQATSVQDATGTIATYIYDALSHLVRVTYADGSQENFTYDANSLITNVTDAQGVVLETHQYDSQRRGTYSSRAAVNGQAADLVRVTYPAGRYVTYVNNSFGAETDYYWSAIGGHRFVSYVNGQGCASCGLKTASSQSFSFFSDGSVASFQEGGRSPISYLYDLNGNMIERSVLINGSWQSWNYTYNNFAQVLTSTDPNGNTTSNQYDAGGNLLSTTAPTPSSGTAASTTSFTYNPNGTLATIRDPLGNVTTLGYSPNSLIHTITDAQNNVTTYNYDARGNRTTVTDARGSVTQFAYDGMNRLTQVTYPTSPATNVQFGYDYRGRRTSVTDQNGKTTQYAYDDADRLTSVTDAQTPTAGVTRYGYDGENNLTSITDALGRQTSFQYDNGGQPTMATFPSNPATNEFYIWDSGDLQYKYDRNGAVMNYNYDSVHRLTLKRYPDGTVVNYNYDQAGRLIQVIAQSASNALDTYSFTYDGMDRLSSASVNYSFLASRTFTTSYTYDAASNRKTMTDPEGGVTTYNYDTLNRLSGLTDFQSNSFTFQYDMLSRRTLLTRPNGVNTSYSYDPLSRLLSVLHQTGGSTVDGTSYTYDAAGNRLSKTDLPGNTTSNYTYDGIYQLLNVTQGSTTTENYSYDAVGNRLSSLGMSPYNYNSSNQLISTPSATYSYDKNGNPYTKVDATGTTSYTWDFDNRLTKEVLPGTAGTVTFKYDPFGRRIQKAFTQGPTTTTTNYLYDGMNSLEEVDNGGNVLARYTQSGLIDEPLGMLRSGVTSYYEADGLSSTSSLSNSTGTLANTYTYDSFGKLTASTGSITNPFQYTEREFDQETGIYEYRARYYDQNNGRFISEDPITFRGGVNFYRYVLNNPVINVDPPGLGPYGWGNKSWTWTQRANCFIAYYACLSHIQDTRQSLDQMTDDAVRNTFDATGSEGGYSNQRLKCGLKQDQNCKDALTRCIKLALTNPFPPPWWLKWLISSGGGK